jgi:hypothetical protein
LIQVLLFQAFLGLEVDVNLSVGGMLGDFDERSRFSAVSLWRSGRGLEGISSFTPVLSPDVDDPSRHPDTALGG